MNRFNSATDFKLRRLLVALALAVASLSASGSGQNVECARAARFESKFPVKQGELVKNLSDEKRDVYLLGGGGFARVYRFVPKDGTPAFVRKYYFEKQFNEFGKTYADPVQSDLIGYEVLNLAIEALSKSGETTIWRPIQVKSVNAKEKYIEFGDVRGSVFDPNISYFTSEKVVREYSRLIGALKALPTSDLNRIVKKFGLSWNLTKHEDLSTKDKVYGTGKDRSSYTQVLKPHLEFYEDAKEHRPVTGDINLWSEVHRVSILLHVGNIILTEDGHLVAIDPK